MSNEVPRSGAADDDRTEYRGWLLPMLGPLWRRFRELIVFSLFINLLPLAVPVFVLQVYDRVIFHAGLTTLQGLAIGMALVIAFDFVLRQARSRLMQRIAIRIDVDLGRRLFDKLAGLPLRVQESRPTAYWQSLFRDAEQVRNEMYLALDYYVTESSGHNSEYNWWFRKRPDLIEKHATHGANWNPGHHAYILKEYRRRENDWRDDIHAWFAQDEIDLERGHEYAAYIINAMEGGTPFKFNGNVPNKGLVDNLPASACVEIPVWVSRDGLEAVAVGPLPQSVAPLTNLYSQIEEMAVEGILKGDKRLIYQAVAYSPLSAAVCSLREIQSMVDELFAVNEAYLMPAFA